MPWSTPRLEVCQYIACADGSSRGLTALAWLNNLIDKTPNIKLKVYEIEDGDHQNLCVITLHLDTDRCAPSEAEGAQAVDRRRPATSIRHVSLP